MNLDSLNERIQKINVRDTFVRYVEDNESMFLDFLKEQLNEGYVGNGSYYTYASIAYSREKQRGNPKAQGRVDFYLEGNFYKGFYIEKLNRGGIQFYSTDEKAAKLTKKYDHIWTYNLKTREKVVNRMLFDFKDYLL